LNGDGKIDDKDDAKRYVGTNPWMYFFGSSLDFWQEATTGYSNLAGLFYSDEEADNQFGILDNQFVNDVLSGIDGWSSMMCRGKITDSDSSGYAFSGTGSDEAFAHVEMERITFINYSEMGYGSGEVKRYIYKITYAVNPGEDDEHCNMEWNYYVDGLKLWSINFNEDDYTDAIGSNAIVDYSDKLYNKICIKFFKLRTGCLEGVYEGDSVCNTVSDGGTYDAATFDFSCDTFVGWAGGCNDAKSSGSGSGSSGSSGSGSSSSSTTQTRTDL